MIPTFKIFFLQIMLTFSIFLELPVFMPFIPKPEILKFEFYENQTAFP
jgi:hypothetical protein